MKVHELAKERGVSAKELAKELGLKSHLSVVPEEMLEQKTETEEKAANFIKQIEEQKEADRKALEELKAKEAEEKKNRLKEIIDQAKETPKEAKKTEEVVEALPEGLTKEAVELGCKTMGSKSRYWKYRHLIGRK